MDYASRLKGVPAAGSETVGPGVASALAGDYAKYLSGGDDAGYGNDGGYHLMVPEGASVTPEQRAILEMIVTAFNRAPKVS